LLLIEAAEIAVVGCLLLLLLIRIPPNQATGQQPVNFSWRRGQSNKQRIAAVSSSQEQLSNSCCAL
jgi:hypothetical protein